MIARQRCKKASCWSLVVLIGEAEHGIERSGPSFVIDTVRDRLIVEVADAEAGFEHRADEGLSRHRHVRCCNALQLWPIFYAVDKQSSLVIVTGKIPGQIEY